MMVDDVVCSRMRMYQEPMDIIEILTVSDAATVQRMSRRFLRVVANRTHHYTPYRQCFRWRVLLPLKPQLKIYSPGNLTRGRRRHCPLSIPEKKISIERKHWKFRDQSGFHIFHRYPFHLLCQRLYFCSFPLGHSAREPCWNVF